MNKKSRKITLIMIILLTLMATSLFSDGLPVIHEWTGKYNVGLSFLNPAINNQQDKEVKPGSISFPYEFKNMITFVGSSLCFYTLLLSLSSNDEFKPFTEDEVLILDRNDINRFDRPATYNLSETAGLISDITMITVSTLPAVLFLHQVISKNYKNAGILGLMFSEGFLLNEELTALTKGIAGRTRPYMYNTSLPIEERIELGSDVHSRRSFFSGHASRTFYCAVFLSKTFQDIYGISALSICVWGFSLALAGTTSYLRFTAGEHYPTDLITGAIIGSSIGYIIPCLYKSKKNNVSMIARSNSIWISYSF